MYCGMQLTTKKMSVLFQVSAGEPHPFRHQEFLLWTENAGAPVSGCFFHPNIPYGLKSKHKPHGSVITQLSSFNI